MAKASGKYAQAISDRSGMAFPYKEMLKNGTDLLYIKQSLKQNIHSLKDKDMQVMHNH